MSAPREPVDWNFVESASVQIWTWQTEHFEVRIFGEGTDRRVYQWIINDRSNGNDRVFEEGSNDSFADAQDMILEILAKSYPQKLGYRKYAGELATTFKVSDGRKLDFGPLEGYDVTVTYEDNEGQRTNAIGTLSVANWAVRVRVDGSSAVKIPPHRIVDVVRDGISVLSTQKVEEQSGPVPIGGKRNRRSTSGKVFHEPYRKGCTGKPGMIPGTVIHSSTDPICPIHG